MQPDKPACQPQPIDERLLRDVCGLFVTGVTVVTSTAGSQPIGTTVNSFTSVSLDPPLVLFCLHKQSRLRRALAESGRFAVNFLAGRQQPLARSFARKETATIPDDAYRRSPADMPILTDAIAFVGCRLTNEFDGGDHIIVLGQVTELGSPRQDHDPLIFYRGSLSALEHQPFAAHPIWDG